MENIISIGVVGFVAQKIARCFNKDYADIISVSTWASVGVFIVMVCNDFYSAIMNSEIVKLLGKIF